MSAQTQTEQQVPAGEYVVDPVHSTIGFAIVHSGVASFRSGFSEYEARLTGGESPSLEGSVAVSSIEIGDEKLKGHLLSPDFFDADSNPRLSFASTALEVAEDGSATLRGELEIAGHRHEVEAAGRFGQVGAYLDGKPRVGLSVAAGVDRREFGLDWNAELPSGGRALEDEVEITVDLEFLAAEEE